MWLVSVALERPYTFVVLALLVLIMSAVAISTTPTDIFPNINIPVVAVDWTYTGHRVNHGQRPGDRENLPAADRQLGYGECAEQSGRRSSPTYRQITSI
jgi:hypothetical protein